MLKVQAALCADSPFTYPANWGGTGLMETPTARVLEEGRYRVGVSQVSPYRYYYMTVSPFKGLEIDGRVTEIFDTKSSSPTWKDYGNYKDKAIDIKYQFLPEGKYTPALAFGIMDPHGTRIYTGQYIVASKQIYPFDFTIGIGNGRFGRKPIASDKEFGIEILEDTAGWLSDAQIFGGIQFTPHPKVAFMVEYNPIRYEKQTTDPAQAKHFSGPVASKINYGVRIMPFDWTEIDISYQRGEQIGVNVSLAFTLGRPLLPIFDPPYIEKKELMDSPLAQRISRGLYKSGFYDIGVTTAGSTIWVVAANDRYFYTPRALAAMLGVLNKMLPENIDKVCIILTERGIPVVEFTTRREDIRYYHDEVFTAGEFLYLAEIATGVYEVPEAKLNYKKYLFYGLKPEINALVNDPSGFLKFRAGASGWVGVNPWRGASLVAGVAAYPLNDVSSSNTPLSIPVRSDFVDYMDNNLLLSMLMFEQIAKFKHEIYAKVAAGLLEVQYAGIDGEIAVPLFDGRFFAGVGGSFVKKRDPSNPLALNNSDWSDNYTTAFVNTRLNIPELEVYVDVKAGRFLAGDHGARVTVSKNFNGVVLSAWYSFTDTSVFSDPYNRGYHDKGIAVSIPLRLFLGRDSRVVHDFSVSPWTRDVAQDIYHRTSLFDFIGRNAKIYIDKDKEEFQ
ncbi:MAG TPA: YjbH domain-containing protein [Smithellaceae bacterium]|nr:YjbH domain-containing protein [Smithellaceae bacterium]